MYIIHTHAPIKFFVYMYSIIQVTLAPILSIIIF